MNSAAGQHCLKDAGGGLFEWRMICGVFRAVALQLLIYRDNLVML